MKVFPEFMYVYKTFTDFIKGEKGKEGGGCDCKIETFTVWKRVNYRLSAKLKAREENMNNEDVLITRPDGRSPRHVLYEILREYGVMCVCAVYIYT